MLRKKDISSHVFDGLAIARGTSEQGQNGTITNQLMQVKVDNPPQTNVGET